MALYPKHEDVAVGTTPPTGSSGGMPPMKLTEKQVKALYPEGGREEWAMQTCQALDLAAHWNPTAPGSLVMMEGRRIQENLELFDRDYFRSEQWSDMLRPYGETHTMPNELGHYPIVVPILKVILGEWLAKPDKWRVVDLSPQSASKLEQHITDGYNDLFMQMFLINMHQEVSKLGLDPAQFIQRGALLDPSVPTIIREDRHITSFKEFDRYANTSYSNLEEKTMNDLLRYLYENDHLKTIFYKNMGRLLATGRMFFMVEPVNGKPVMSYIPPGSITTDALYDDDFIEKASWIRHVEVLPASEVEDRFFDVLTDEEVAYIERIKGTMLAFDTSYTGAGVSNGSQGMSNTMVRVARFEWDALTRLGLLRTATENGFEYTQVAEDYKIQDKDNEEIITWVWAIQRWMGYKIGECCFVKLQPLPYAPASITTPSKRFSSYFGYNGKTSLLDVLKPLQLQYNIIMWKIKQTLMRDKGVVARIDIAQMPKTKEWTLESWLQLIDTHGIMLINSREPVLGGRAAGVTHPGTNPFEVMNLTTTAALHGYIKVLEFLKEEVSSLSGITRQRLGETQSRETLGGIEHSLHQSSAATAYLFHTMEEVQKRGYTILLEVAKFCYKDGLQTSLVLDDSGRTLLNLDMTKYRNAEFGVFPVMEGRDVDVLEQLRGALPKLMEAQQISFRDFVRGMKTKSMTELTAIAEDAEIAKAKRQEKEAQSQQNPEMAKQQLQATIAQQEDAFKRAELEMRRYETDANNARAVEVAHINAEGRVTSYRTDVNPDANNNQVVDVAERKLDLQQQSIDMQRERHLDMMDAKAVQHEDKMTLEHKKLHVKGSTKPK